VRIAKFRKNERIWNWLDLSADNSDSSVQDFQRISASVLQAWIKRLLQRQALQILARASVLTYFQNSIREKFAQAGC